MPRLAIVVSAVGTTEQLEATLVSVLENRPADCQVIVALERPYTDPYDLKDEVRFVQAPVGARPTAAIHQALATTRAPFVHLLASGCRVTEGWADEALSRFGDRRVASVAPTVHDADAPERLLAAGVGYRASGSRYLVGRGLSELSVEAQGSVVGPCGFAAFYRKAAIDFVGGLSSQLGPRQADVDLALVLKRAGFSVALAPRSEIFANDAADPPQESFREALWSERLFWRNLSIEPRRGRAVAAHAVAVALELLTSFPRPRLAFQLAARSLGCLQIGAYVRHHYALDELARRALRPKLAHDHARLDGAHDVAAHSQTARLHAR